MDSQPTMSWTDSPLRPGVLDMKGLMMVERSQFGLAVFHPDAVVSKGVQAFRAWALTDFVQADDASTLIQADERRRAWLKPCFEKTQKYMKTGMAELRVQANFARKLPELRKTAEEAATNVIAKAAGSAENLGCSVVSLTFFIPHVHI